MAKHIPDSDLALINDSFRQHHIPVQTLGKDANGRLIAPSIQIVNKDGFVISSFMGRTLRHNKFLVPLKGNTLCIGAKGQKFDNIPLHLRQQIAWNESDFE